MPYTINITTKALKQLSKLPPAIQAKIVSTINALAVNPRPIHCKKLRTPRKGKLEVFYRVRVNDYRVVYQIKDSVLLITIIIIGHRKDIYSNL